MCGIAGAVEFREGARVDATILERMCAAMLHRGPDDQGTYCEGRAGLAAQRLSIIDLAGGHQPISNEDGSLWIVFNGEIYNYRQLQTELGSRGHRFRTGSDTETILHLFEEQGIAAAAELRGMFACALWDNRAGTLTLLRDR